MNSLIDILNLQADAFGKIHKERITGPHGKLKTLRPGESVSMRLPDSGLVRRIWLVMNGNGKDGNECQEQLTSNHEIYRRVWMTINFNNAAKPQIDVPVADFFLFGHGAIEDIDSRWIQTIKVPPMDQKPFQGALNCFIPMPFNDGMSFTITNKNEFPIRIMGLVDWQDAPRNDPCATLHASYKSATCDQETMVILDESDKQGVLFGLSLNVVNGDGKHRWHEACDYFKIDDDAETIRGTGMEDYFGLAWGFRKCLTRSDFGVVYAHPDGGRATLPSGIANSKGEFTMYRFKPFDYLGFKKKIKFYFGGTANAIKNCRLENELSVSYRSVAYWYSYEPALEC